VVECCRCPCTGSVAGTAIRSETASVSVVFLMTGIAITGSAFVDIVDMAIAAGYRCMRAGQFESGQIVVKGGGSPGSGCMAGPATCPVAAGVIIVVLMTGIAVAGCALVDVIGMAIGTGNRGMGTCQLERGQIVIEGSGSPGVG
jgi:hypothetical protein